MTDKSVLNYNQWLSQRGAKSKVFYGSWPNCINGPHLSPPQLVRVSPACCFHHPAGGKGLLTTYNFVLLWLCHWWPLWLKLPFLKIKQLSPFAAVAQKLMTVAWLLRCQKSTLHCGNMSSGTTGQSVGLHLETLAEFLVDSQEDYGMENWRTSWK